MEIVEKTVTKVVRYIEFDGIKFYPDKKGYWLGQLKGTKKPIRLHTYVWEYYNGEVPQGYHVHHKDHNPDNNEIDNLVLITEAEHLSMHGQLQNKEWLRKNLAENARPKASEWHKSAEGRKWHSDVAKATMPQRLEDTVTMKCQYCGKDYEIPRFLSEGSRFCSNNCKSAWRRKAGLDNVETTCIVCGKKFFTNKYNSAKYCSAECRKSNWHESRQAH